MAQSIDYKRLSATLENFRHSRFYREEPMEPSRADQYLDDRSLMDWHFSRAYAQALSDFGSRMRKPTHPLVETVVQSKAVAFKENPKISLIKSDGTDADSATFPVVNSLQRILEESGMIRAMEVAEELCVAHMTAGVWFRIIDNEVVISALPPYAFDIEPNKFDPANTTKAKAIVVPINGNGPAEDKEQFVQYQKDGKDILAFVRDKDGNQFDVDIEESENGRLFTNRYPLVVWREKEGLTAYAPLPNALLNAQININLLLCQLSLAQRLASFGIIVDQKDRDAGEFEDRERSANPGNYVPESIEIPANFYDVVQLPVGHKLEVMQTRVEIEQFTKHLEWELKRAYVGMELVPSSVDISNPLPGNYSGKARMIDAMPLEGARQRREGRLSKYAVETLRTFRAFWNRVCSPEERIPEELDFKVGFSSLWSPDIIENQSAMQAIETAIRLGLVDPVAIRQSIDQSTPADARKKYFSGVGTVAKANEIMNSANV